VSSATADVIAARARAIANGLIRTERAPRGTKVIHGMMRLECFGDGYYWIALDGSRLLRGRTQFEADELQPKFIDAMERAGH